MLSITDSYERKIKAYGKQLNSLVTLNNIVLDKNYVKKVKLLTKGELFTSIMREVEIEIENYATVIDNIDNIDTVKIEPGVRISEFEDYEYLDWGEFVVYSKEEKIETHSLKLHVFDHMIDSHIKYVENPLSLDYSTGTITVLVLLRAICDKLGWTLITNNFSNANKIINEDKYANLNDFTYRDILDEIAATAGGFIKIYNKDLYVSYPTDTGKIIDENDLKKLTIGKKVGEYNTVVLGRTPQEDNIVYPSIPPASGRYSIRIDNNQIMDKNRSDFIEEIYNRINGLFYYLFEYDSFGFGYYEFGDIVTLKDLNGNEYKTILFDIMTEITSGIIEKANAQETEYSETKYQYATGIEKRVANTELITNKQQLYIDALVSDMYEEDGFVHENFTQVHQDIENIIQSVQNSGGANLIKNSVMFAYDNENRPNEWELSGNGTISISSSAESLANGGISGHVFTLNNKTVKQTVTVKANNEDDSNKMYYTFSTKIKKNLAGSCYVKLYNSQEEYIISIPVGENAYYKEYVLEGLLPKENYYIVEFYGSSGSDATFTDNMLNIGETKRQWGQASGEIMNTQVNVNLNGVLVKSSIYAGDYTVMSPLEFAGYSNINGVITKVFTVNKDTTEVEKLKSRKSISMPPIKIVPITTGNLQGWAFVPSTD